MLLLFNGSRHVPSTTLLNVSMGRLPPPKEILTLLRLKPLRQYPVETEGSTDSVPIDVEDSHMADVCADRVAMSGRHITMASVVGNDIGRRRPSSLTDALTSAHSFSSLL